MTMSRRKTLALLGGGAIAAIAAPSAAFLTTRTPHAALAPWDKAGGYGDARMDALSWALLAPNPHNRQPWEAELRGEDTVAIWRDKTRDLPVTDPFGRQLTIGMGCFIELMEMAAGQAGIAVETVLFPEGEEGTVAVCRFGPGGKANPLFEYVLDRRSHKEAFEPRAVTAAASLERHARLFLDGPDRDALRDFALEAWLIEAATPEAWQESIDLLRIGKAEINAQPDGIDAGGPMLETLALLGLFTRETASDPNNAGSQDAIQSTASAIAGAPAISLTVTQGNTRADQIEAGRQWMRLNLAATGAGLALRPVSQALQEYAEVTPVRDALHAQFATEGETVQMLGLLGYGVQTPRTPRWPLESRLKRA